MKPTCGPLPWPITTFQPSWIIAAMCQQVSPAAMYWSRTVWCSLVLDQRVAADRHDRGAGLHADTSSFVE